VDYLKALREAPITPKTVPGYIVREPNDGFDQEFYGMIKEMLRRGYEIRLVFKNGEEVTLLPIPH
jgi:hypothetical protein